MIWILVFGGIAVCMVILFLVLRNTLIASRNLVDAAFADIDAQLLKRYELIPKLIQIAQVYAQHEGPLLEALAAKRSGIWDKDDNFPQILNKINVIKEAYPDLKADQQFEKLMHHIRETENHLLYSRQFYNGTVEAYNRQIAQIPYSFFSARLGHHQRNYIQATHEQQEIPTHD